MFRAAIRRPLLVLGLAMITTAVAAGALVGDAAGQRTMAAVGAPLAAAAATRSHADTASAGPGHTTASRQAATVADGKDVSLSPPVPHVAAPPPPPPVPAHPQQNWLTSDDGSVSTGVGTYGDCSGRSEVGHELAYIDTCASSTYFIAHNPGVFSPLLGFAPGSGFTWWDSAGVAHHIHVVATRDWQRVDGLAGGGARYEFQTCVTLDASVDRILDAEEG